ncbi:putative B-cell scaffold protein with ankyrin repeats [Scophthalmus maximus]|uniref:Putative B-cell scaffold protein with ankyrin repeats n=1 Tax=Scophthalmus maximus TaxID=52904 RepID=A0A2U9BAN5_SCOMX|nr:putative B-cell scaffold protein with ankyrin repeats [Scophthalmus maximus]
MSCTAKDVLIIYQTEAEQWATYLKSVFAGPIPEAGICCYDIATVSSRRDDFPGLDRYNCKLLILSKGMLEGFCQGWRFFLARVLSPAAHVVVLLCGVESVTPLLELVPLSADEYLQISSEQDVHEYLSTVINIVGKGVSATAANVNPLTCKLSGSEQKGERLQSAGVHGDGCRLVPARVPCGASTEVFILLKDEAPGGDTEVEFTGENQMRRAEPVHWNDRTLCVNAPDFPAGNVRVTVYSNGVPLSKAQLQYYSSMEEVACLLSRVADPVDFMCQALQLSSVDALDEELSSMLLEGMPTGGFPALPCVHTPERESRNADVPSLLHFAAQHGFKSVSSLLLQCPGVERALHTANRRGQTPAEIAKIHGHKELHVLLEEKLVTRRATSRATFHFTVWILARRKRQVGQPLTQSAMHQTLLILHLRFVLPLKKEFFDIAPAASSEALLLGLQRGKLNLSGMPGAPAAADICEKDLAFCSDMLLANGPDLAAASLSQGKTAFFYPAGRNIFSPGEDSGDVYEVMGPAGNPSTAAVQRVQRAEDEGEEVEELYGPLEMSEEYETILNSTKTPVIANRPPAPKPRPEGTQVKKGRTLYIRKVFQKKKTPPANADLYSLPTIQAPGRDDSALSTYDTFVPNQIDGLQWLSELQRRVKAGSLTVDQALERFSDWQRVQKGMDAAQKEKLNQLRARIINSGEDDNGVYDEINIVHYTPSAMANKSRRGSQTLESDSPSRPLKGQLHVGLLY